MPRRHLVTAWSVVFLVLLPVLFRGNHTIDLEVYGQGGRALLAGEPVYGGYVRGHTVSPPLDFTYPPFAAVLAALLAPFPRLLSELAWLAGEVAVLVALVAGGAAPALRRLPVRARGPALAAASLLLAFALPVIDHLGFGQVNLFLLALCLADVAAPRVPWPRGAGIGVATAVKLVPGLFVVFLVVGGRRRAATWAAGVFGACTLLALLVSPSDSRDYWTRALFDTSRVGYQDEWRNQSLDGMLLRLRPGTPTVLWLLLAVAVAFVGLARARRLDRQGQQTAAAVVVGLTACLVAPIAWIHHLVWLVPAVGVLLGDARDRRRVGAAVLLVALMVARGPTLGQALLSATGRPTPLTELLRDSLGLCALAVVLFLRPAAAARPRHQVPAEAAPARPGAAPAPAPAPAS